MTISLVFDILLILHLASYNDISLHACRVDNSLIGESIDFYLACFVHLARFVDSWVRNDLICELIAYHVVLGCQSLSCRIFHLDHFTSLRVDGMFIVTTTHLYLGE